MNRLLFFLCGLTIFFWTSCSEDFDITTEWKDIPVVYGILSSSDTMHYIRLEKAFLDPQKNALIMAREPDSIYYRNAVVKIKDLATGITRTLEKVDGNEIGREREDGIFATEPNILYRISNDDLRVLPERSYQLLIERSENSVPVTATTTIPRDVVIQSPRTELPIRLNLTNSLRISWVNVPEVSLIDVWLNFGYEEWPQGNPLDRKEELFRWKIGFKVTNNTLNVQGEQFFRALASSLEENPSIVRRAKFFDIRIVGAGPEFADFIRLFIANSGVTGTQELPRYTNLSEGFGIFSSRIRVNTGPIDVSGDTKRVLSTSDITKHLGFIED